MRFITIVTATLSIAVGCDYESQPSVNSTAQSLELSATPARETEEVRSATEPSADEPSEGPRRIDPPVNAPTDPNATQPSPQDLVFASHQVVTRMRAPREDSPAASREGRAIASCDGVNGECGTQTDCGDGETCLCRPLSGFSACVPADCTTDSDCGEGLSCVETIERSGSDVECTTAKISLHCTSNEDGCNPGRGDCGRHQACVFETETAMFACVDLCSKGQRMRDTPR